MPSLRQRANPARRQKMAAVAFRSFFKITGKWGLSAQEQIILLGGIPRSTFYKWKGSDGSNTTVPNDTLERISNIVGIYKALHSLFSEDKVADNWINWPSKNPLFGGKSPKDRMLAGQVSDLNFVRRYLDTQCWASH